MNRDSVDICIIGGGASGLVAAIAAARESKKSVLILERNDVPGKKLAAAGNGRCNLSNLKCEDWERTCGFFSSLGLMTRSDSEGRVYPYSEDGRDVVEALVREAGRLSVKIRAGCAAVSIELIDSVGVRNSDGASTAPLEDAALGGPFQIKTGDGAVIIANKLLIATGGKSYPVYGTIGDGYGFARGLGHNVTRLAPVLTAIETCEDLKNMGLPGIRAKAIATLLRGDREICREAGEIQFTDYGLSGICIFNLSREIRVEDGEEPIEAIKKYSVSLDLIPEMSPEELDIWISDRRASGESGADLLRTLVKRKLAEAVIHSAKMAGECSTDEAAAKVLKDFRFNVKNLRGWEHAQITSGGVALSEVDPETMESRLIPGLFFAGEVLDYDGPSGGFNLQNAWTTGIKAGRAMVGLT